MGNPSPISNDNSAPAAPLAYVATSGPPHLTFRMRQWNLIVQPLFEASEPSW